MPPEMRRISPVTQEELGSQSVATPKAMSSGWPQRPSGIAWRIRSIISSSVIPSVSHRCAITFRLKSVYTGPGQIALTRTPYAASSSASERVKAITPALATL